MRVVLADDHQIFRHALKALLEREGDLQVVGEACNGDELLSVAVREAAELVCIDVAMPGMNGVEATRRLLMLRPDTKVVGLSAFADRQIVLDMLNAGAKGYVTKTEPGEELLRAIRTVSAATKELLLTSRTSIRPMRIAGMIVYPTSAMRLLDE